MKWLSTAHISIDEVAIYRCYRYWWISYLLLLSVLKKQLSTADIGIDEVAIYCC